MPEQSNEKLVEVRFDPSRNLYKAALWAFSIGIGIAAFCLAFEIVALTSKSSPQVGIRSYRVGIFTELRAAIIGCGSGLIALGAVGVLAIDARRNWRDWRQLRKPRAVVDPEGVRFESRRGIVRIPWSDVERLVLRRYILPSRALSTLRIQISADSTSLEDMRIPSDSDRWRSIGEIEGQANVSYDDAVRILNRVAGSRLEITERFYRNQRA